jgi:quinate/shikimate dehydrogenase (NAD+)
VATARRFVVGLIGASVGASLSPPLHEHEADRLGLRYIYQIIDIDLLAMDPRDVGELVRRAADMGFAGVNITYPCKQLVVPHLHSLSPDAAALGAVNTVVFTADGRSVGHNTDWSGFAAGFRRGLPDVPLDHVILLGAGGAGTAVAYALMSLGVRRLTVVDVDPARAIDLVTLINQAATFPGRDGQSGTAEPGIIDDVGAHLATADGLVNASPVGMTPRLGSPLPLDLLDERLWVADIVYRPLVTELLHHAKQLGCRTLDGGDMVVYQAAAAFELFTGVRPDADRMLRHFAELTADAAIA